MILVKLKNEEEEQALRKDHLSDKKDYWKDELKSLGIEPDHLKNQPKVEEEELRALAESIKSVYYRAYKTAYSDNSSNSSSNNNRVAD
jgi:hypothetical protein